MFITFKKKILTYHKKLSKNFLRTSLCIYKLFYIREIICKYKRRHYKHNKHWMSGFVVFALPRSCYRSLEEFVQGQVRNTTTQPPRLITADSRVRSSLRVSKRTNLWFRRRQQRFLLIIMIIIKYIKHMHIYLLFVCIHQHTPYKIYRRAPRPIAYIIIQTRDCRQNMT